MAWPPTERDVLEQAAKGGKVATRLSFNGSCNVAFDPPLLVMDPQYVVPLAEKGYFRLRPGTPEGVEIYDMTAEGAFALAAGRNLIAPPLDLDFTRATLTSSIAFTRESVAIPGAGANAED